MAAIAASGAGLVGFKGNQSLAKAAKQTADYNAKLAENEAIILARRKVEEENNMRQQSERLIASQRVATAASGIEMSGSALQALADSYFNTEMDALKIQYAADIEQTQKQAEATLARAEGRARASALKTQSYQSLLQGGLQAAQLMA